MGSERRGAKGWEAPPLRRLSPMLTARLDHDRSPARSDRSETRHAGVIKIKVDGVEHVRRAQIQAVQHHQNATETASRLCKAARPGDAAKTG